MPSGETRATAQPRLSFRLPLDPARLQRARERVRDYLYEQHVTGDAIDDIVLALEEAMTNAVRHSHADSDLEVDLHVEGDDLIARVRDHGDGFDVSSFDRTQLPDPFALGGRGLYLIAHLMDDMKLCRNGGIEVYMRKRGLEVPLAVAPAPSLGTELGGDSYRAARQRVLVEDMSEAFASLDWEYRVSFGNKAALSFFGLQAREVVGRSFWDVFPRTRDLAVGEAVRRAMELGVSSIEEYVSPTLGRWVETRVYPTSSGVSIYLRDIDERKRRELERDELFGALRASELRLRRFYEAGLLGVIYWTTEGGIVEANDRFLQMVGYTRAELDAGEIDWISMTPPEFADQDARSLEELQATGVNAAPFEKEFVRKDGSRLPVLVAGALLDEERTNGVAFVLDISQRKRAERSQMENKSALEKVTAQRQLALDAARLGWWHYDPVTEISWYDEGYRDIFGVTGTERPNEEILRRLHPDDLPEVWRRVELALDPRDPQPYAAEYRIFLDDGSVRWIEAHGIASFAGEGSERRATSLIGTVQDITERKLAESTLRESEERFRIALRSTRVSVAAQDSELRYIWAYNLQSATPDDLIGRTDAELFSGDDADRLAACKRRVIDEDAEVTERMWLQGPDGPRYYDMTWGPMHDEQGRVIGVSTAAVDLTEWKLAEDRLSSQARLGDALAAIDGLLHSSLEPDEIFQAALREGALALGAESATIAGIEDGEWTLWYVHGSSTSAPGDRFTPEQHPHGVLAAETRDVVAIDDCLADERVRAEPMETYGIRSCVVAPLLVRGETIASLSFNHVGHVHRFDETEIRFVKNLAGSLSLALDNARLFSEQYDIALTLQQNFLHPLPQVDGFDLASVTRTASDVELVGGDFSDAFVLADGRLLVVIGDVAGKGIRAAGLTETVRSAVRAFATVDTAPAFILRKTNDLLLQQGTVYDPHVTALVCVIDRDTGLASIGSAGHPPPVYLSAEAAEVWETPYGPPLGTFTADYSTSHLALASGDGLVLYTDGVTEARRDGELFGEARLREAAERLLGLSAQEAARGVADAAIEYGGELRDDLHVVVVRLT